MTPKLAEHVLTLGLTTADREAAGELLRLSASGSLTREQEVELENYRRAGRVFELLKSKARIALRSSTQSG